MKFFLRFILIAGLSYISLQFLEWWSIAIIAFLVGLLLSEKRKKRLFGNKQYPAYAFLAGFLAIFFLWGIKAILIDMGNESILSTKIADIFFKGAAPAYMLIVGSALIGGLVGGFSAMTGNLLGEAIKNP